MIKVSAWRERERKREKSPWPYQDSDFDFLVIADRRKNPTGLTLGRAFGLLEARAAGRRWACLLAGWHAEISDDTKTRKTK